MSCCKYTIGDTWSIGLYDFRYPRSGTDVDLTGATITCTLQTTPELSVSTGTGGITIYDIGERADGLRVNAQFEDVETATVEHTSNTLRGEFEILTSAGQRTTQPFTFRTRTGI